MAPPGRDSSVQIPVISLIVCSSVPGHRSWWALYQSQSPTTPNQSLWKASQNPRMLGIHDISYHFMTNFPCQELMLMGCDFLAKRPGLVEAAPGQRWDRGRSGEAQVHPMPWRSTSTHPCSKFSPWCFRNHELLSLAKVCSSG